MWTIFKIFIEFVTTLFLFYALVFWPQGMWDLSSLTRDQTLISYIGRLSLNHSTAREVPIATFSRFNPNATSCRKPLQMLQPGWLLPFLF